MLPIRCFAQIAFHIGHVCRHVPSAQMSKLYESISLMSIPANSINYKKCAYWHEKSHLIETKWCNKIAKLKRKQSINILRAASIFVAKHQKQQLRTRGTSSNVPCDDVPILVQKANFTHIGLDTVPDTRYLFRWLMYSVRSMYWENKIMQIAFGHCKILLAHLK